MPGRACVPLARGWSGRRWSAAEPSGWKCFRFNKLRLEAFLALMLTVFVAGSARSRCSGAGRAERRPRPRAVLCWGRGGAGGGAWAGPPPSPGSSRPAGTGATMAAERDRERELRFYRRLPKAVSGGGRRARTLLRRQRARAADGQTERQTLLLSPSSSRTRGFWGPYPTAKCIGCLPVGLFTDLANLIAIKSVERDLLFSLFVLFPLSLAKKSGSDNAFSPCPRGVPYFWHISARLP